MFSDFKNFRNNSPSKSYIAVLINPNFYSVLLYRLSNFMYRNKLSFIAKILWFMNRIIFSVDIDYRADIGKNFMIVHGIGIVIGSSVKIGDNCKIYQGVTIGGDSNKNIIVNGKRIWQPILEDNVVVYSNSVLVGPIVIGENSIVGSCSFVNKNIQRDLKFITKKECILINK